MTHSNVIQDVHGRLNQVLNSPMGKMGGMLPVMVMSSQESAHPAYSAEQSSVTSVTALGANTAFGASGDLDGGCYDVRAVFGWQADAAARLVNFRYRAAGVNTDLFQWPIDPTNTGYLDVEFCVDLPDAASLRFFNITAWGAGVVCYGSLFWRKRLISS